MLKERLQNLDKQYPDYSGMFQIIIKWFDNNPMQKYLRSDILYNEVKGFEEYEISTAVFILNKEGVISIIYRVIDNSGVKIGKDYSHYDEIPDFLTTMWGEEVQKANVLVVPYYILHNKK